MTYVGHAQKRSLRPFASLTGPALARHLLQNPWRCAGFFLLVSVDNNSLWINPESHPTTVLFFSKGPVALLSQVGSRDGELIQPGQRALGDFRYRDIDTVPGQRSKPVMPAQAETSDRGNIYKVSIASKFRRYPFLLINRLTVMESRR